MVRLKPLGENKLRSGGFTKKKKKWIIGTAFVFFCLFLRGRCGRIKEYVI